MGVPPSLLRGDETLEELRLLLGRFALLCPLAAEQPPCLSSAYTTCPFRLLGLLTHSTRTSLIDTLDRHGCISLFDLELDTRGDALCSTQAKPACSGCGAT
jgi:hypothetical protein